MKKRKRTSSASLSSQSDSQKKRVVKRKKSVQESVCDAPSVDVNHVPGSDFDDTDNDVVQFNTDFSFQLHDSSSNPLAQLAKESALEKMTVLPPSRMGTAKTSVDELIRRYKAKFDDDLEDESQGMECDTSAQTIEILGCDGSDAKKDKVRSKAKKGSAKGKGVKQGFSEVISKPDVDMSFLKMNLSRPLLRSLSELKWHTPTPIQSACIPVALLGKDICACARTGSGKTGAFMLPILERLIYKPPGPPTTRVLVLSPTRELTVQIYNVSTQLARYCNPQVSINLSAGGLDLKAQEASLRLGPDIVIATPGRLIDHLHNAPNFHLKNVEILVLDEADKLIDQYFIEQIKEVVRLCSTTRQVLLFSATMTDDVNELAAMALKDPVKLFISSHSDVTLKLHQEFVRIRQHREDDREAIVASLLLRTFADDRTIVFCPTKKSCHRMHILLGLLNVNCGELHSNMSQSQRLEGLQKFHSGDINVLLATDLVSRGLDIEGVSSVINMSLPSTLKVYTHRVGRTARAGKQGLAVSLVGEDERSLLRQIVKNAPIPVKVRVIPKTVIAKFRKKISDLEPAIVQILEEEKVESAQRSAEHALNKAEKRLANADSAPSMQRNWFQTEQKRKKQKAKKSKA